MTRLLISAAVVISLLLAMSGCTSTTSATESTAATHYWESSASTREYKADHSVCEQKSLVDADSKLDPDSTSFSAYRDCMIKEGYTLRTY